MLLEILGKVSAVFSVAFEIMLILNRLMCVTLIKSFIRFFVGTGSSYHLVHERCLWHFVYFSAAAKQHNRAVEISWARSTLRLC